MQPRQCCDSRKLELLQWTPYITHGENLAQHDVSCVITGYITQQQQITDRANSQHNESLQNCNHNAQQGRIQHLIHAYSDCPCCLGTRFWLRCRLDHVRLSCDFALIVLETSESRMKASSNSTESKTSEFVPSWAGH